MNDGRIYRATLGTVGVLAALLVVGACDRGEPTKEASTLEQRAPKVATFDPPEAGPLLEDIAEKRTLELTEARRFPECHEILEPMGELVARFPIRDRVERALALTGCGPEAHRVEADRRFIAFGGPEHLGSRVRDLRFVAFDADGKRLWAQTMDRSSEGANYIANYRDSFIALLPPRLACAGTLWEGGTQAMCLDWNSGDKRWDGRMPFWSGIKPQAHGDGLVVADLSSMTRRYPFSGVEMRYRRLEGIGGRAAFYVADSKSLFFAPSRTEQPELLRYDFDAFAASWRMKLPEGPAAGYGHIFEEHDLLVLKIGDVVHALDTTSAEHLWSYDVGDDRPPMVMHGDDLLVLRRRPDEPNTLVALDPRSGERRWSAETPSGTLTIHSLDGVLVLKSVRAVQHATNLDVPAPAVSSAKP